MQLDFVIVERYIVNGSGCGLQDRFPLCMLAAEGHRCQPERPSALPAIFLHYPSLLSEFPNSVRSNRPALLMTLSQFVALGLSKKIPGAITTYDTRLILCRSNATGCVTHSIAQIELGPFGDRNHSI